MYRREWRIQRANVRGCTVTGYRYEHTKLAKHHPQRALAYYHPGCLVFGGSIGGSPVHLDRSHIEVLFIVLERKDRVRGKGKEREREREREIYTLVLDAAPATFWSYGLSFLQSSIISSSYYTHWSVELFLSLPSLERLILSVDILPSSSQKILQLYSSSVERWKVAGT